MGYRGKVDERRRARERRAQSWTLQEIAGELGVSRGSVSSWVRDVEFVPRPRHRGHPAGPKRPMRLEQEAELEACRIDAERWAGERSARDLLVDGAARYAGEGAKTERSAVRMANTSPVAMRVYMRWLRTFFDIDEQRLRGRIYLHAGFDLEAATRFWSEQLGVPTTQFQVPYRPSATPSAPVKHLNGCVTVIYSSLSIHRRVMALIGAITSGLDDPG